MKRFLLYCSIGLFFIGCNSSTPNQPSSFVYKVKPKQAIQISSSISIDVKGVCDSRCPEGCECIWAGEAKVFFAIKDDNSVIDTNLILPSRQKMTYKNFSIELKSVDPYPICNYEFPSELTVRFQVDDKNKGTL